MRQFGRRTGTYRWLFFLLLDRQLRIATTEEVEGFPSGGGVTGFLVVLVAVVVVGGGRVEQRSRLARTCFIGKDKDSPDHKRERQRKSHSFWNGWIKIKSKTTGPQTNDCCGYGDIGIVGTLLATAVASILASRSYLPVT